MPGFWLWFVELWNPCGGSEEPPALHRKGQQGEPTDQESKSCLRKGLEYLIGCSTASTGLKERLFPNICGVFSMANVWMKRSPNK